MCGLEMKGFNKYYMRLLVIPNRVILWCLVCIHRTNTFHINKFVLETYAPDNSSRIKKLLNAKTKKVTPVNLYREPKWQNCYPIFCELMMLLQKKLPWLPWLPLKDLLPLLEVPAMGLLLGLQQDFISST